MNSTVKMMLRINFKMMNNQELDKDIKRSAYDKLSGYIEALYDTGCIDEETYTKLDWINFCMYHHKKYEEMQNDLSRLFGSMH